MHVPAIDEELAALRRAEWEQQSQHHWYVEQALAGARRSPRTARGLAPLLRRVALRVAWRLTRIAGAESGPYTVKGRVTLVDARGVARTVCPEEIAIVLLPRTNRDAA